MSAPPLGLLLDVDGPLASTRTRTLRLPAIARDLVALAQAGCPVVFNTGRSVDFLAERLLPALVDAGLGPADPVWGVGEKGGTWFSLADRGGTAAVDDIAEDPAMSPPPAVVDAVRALVDRDFSDLVFFDETKRTMISVEHFVEVPGATFLARRDELAAAISRILDDHGVADETTIYPTVISIDVEHATSGKALGARRALDLVAPRMDPPRRWFTAGDSGQDYDMARYLDAHGFTATHLDVRPTGDVPDVSFEVIREVPHTREGDAEDDITARHLARLRAEVIA
ncbi:hypothetical protein [Microbacterium excoecariae]|uniref:hypothetical protein n=1 Tax=Microbacterium excoecariae TaxID=2715210 RepID=UPI001407E9DD|nr:hypothetical protein [Microbacterium excoecariae]NHI17001.1 hypothetical protein [Microbacterium excoecariae]